MGQEYFVRLAIHTQSGSSTFSSWESVTTYEGERATPLYVFNIAWADAVLLFTPCVLTPS